MLPLLRAFKRFVVILYLNLRFLEFVLLALFSNNDLFFNKYFTKSACVVFLQNCFQTLNSLPVRPSSIHWSPMFECIAFFNDVWHSWTRSDVLNWVLFSWLTLGNNRAIMIKISWKLRSHFIALVMACNILNLF